MPCYSKLAVTLLLVLPAVSSLGCRGRGRVVDTRYQQFSQQFVDAQRQSPDTVEVTHPVDEVLAGAHSVDRYIEIGLRQNSEVQEVRLRVESLANRVPQAASLPDPTLGATAFPSPVQTAAGEQEFALAMSQRVPGRGKLATQAAMAEEDVNAARAELAAIELKVVEQIKRAYFQLYFVQQAISIIENDKQQLELIENVVDQMYRVKPEVSQQDVLQVQVAISRVEAELVQYRQQQTTARAKLARLLHISPETPLAALSNLPPRQVTQDIQRLYERAIQRRPELHAQLATLQRDRHATCLAELANYPDMTFGFNWIATSNDGLSPVANGDDALLLTFGMNLPVYRKRIDAGVREAQARALSNARKYERLKDETLEGVADLMAKIDSLQITLRLFREDIIPKQELTLDQSIEDYQVGNVDFLQMIDNWRQLLRFHIQEKRLEADLQKAIAALARQVGEFDLPKQDVPSRPTVLEGYPAERPGGEPSDDLSDGDLSDGDLSDGGQGFANRP